MQATLQFQVDVSSLVDLIVERITAAQTIDTADLVGGVVSAHRLRRALAVMRSWHGIDTEAARIAFQRAKNEARKMEAALAKVGLESDLVCDMITARKHRPDVDALDGYSRDDVYKVHAINRTPKHASRRPGHRQAAASTHAR